MVRGSTQRAQAILEFALIVPLIIFFLFAIVDFGIAMDRRITLQHAVREGARYAAVTEDPNLICDRTRDQAQGITHDFTISYEDIDGNGANTDAGDAVNVRADFTYNLLIVGPVLNGLFGGNVGAIDMSPTASARLERSMPSATDTVCP